MNCKHIRGCWAVKDGMECTMCGKHFSNEEYEKLRKEQEKLSQTCKHEDTGVVTGVYYSHRFCNVCGKLLD